MDTATKRWLALICLLVAGAFLLDYRMHRTLDKVVNASKQFNEQIFTEIDEIKVRLSALPQVTTNASALERMKLEFQQMREAIKELSDEAAKDE